MCIRDSINGTNIAELIFKKSKSVFAIVATGDTEKYANIILKKGVTPN